ncbi:substrate-binding domain-containing protein [Enterococcus timonensis]|uniref:substrate-binding domain-containing protein n=1 Tax=Enterococcus timonensis TaxID=1852364 RepID=UPI0008D9FA8E|nr:substrate-binding domain-containing protein [Enterococcus timonensis]
MKNNKIFYLIEGILALIAVILTIVMLNGTTAANTGKVAVIVPDSDSSQWVLLKYGLKMAADDAQIDLYIVDTKEKLTAADQQNLIEQEIANGAEAIILQPTVEADTEAMLANLAQKIPILSLNAQAVQTSKINAIETDNYQIGMALAAEVLKDYSNDLTGKTIGLVSTQQKDPETHSRQEGFEAGIKNKGGLISWEASAPVNDAPSPFPRTLPAVNIVVGLDDRSLVSAGQFAATNDLKGAVVYGVGHSNEAIYYLDTDLISCLVIPDEFEAGYQSVLKTAQRLKKPFSGLSNEIISYKIVRRDDLFTKENEELLFMISQ